MNTAFNFEPTLNRIIFRKAATPMQTDLQMFPLGNSHVPGEVHGLATDWASMHLFASIVERCEDPIISVTTEGVIMTWNNSAERIFGFTADEIVGQPYELLLRGDGEAGLKKYLAGAWRGENVHLYEAIRYSKHGKKIPVRVTCSPVCDRSNQVIGVSEIVREISDSERCERNEPTNERLMAMGRLASRIAHEINNPLASVTNLLFLLQQESLTANATEYVAIAQREVARIAQMSAQSLGIYRFSGQAALCELADIVDEAVVLCRDRITVRRTAVRRDYSPVPMFSCHRDEMRQVMLNVITNALDAMPHGGTLRLKIRGRKDWSTGGKGIVITVGDTGKGMGAKARTKLFEPFFTTKEATGLGLGLWGCAHVLTKYGGRIQVRSNEAAARSGTVLAMFLPT